MTFPPRNLALRLLGLLLSGLCLLRGAPAGPENQVFQWSVSGENGAWPDGSKSRGTLYLWVPDNCHRLRGLVIMCTNVPEHGLVNHPAIRRACAESDLGIIWSVPTFWRFGKVSPQPGAAPVEVKALPGSDRIQMEFLERLIAQLAEKSGYAECATVPWLPVGESGHLLMVAGLVNERPDRCIAAICVKNPHTPANHSVPMLWTLGTGQEWGQAKVDIRDHWRNVAAYPGWSATRAQTDWPLSIVVEAGTGHFYCSDEMADHFGHYIVAACRARLAENGTNILKPVRLETGVLAHLPLPGQSDLSVTPYAEATPATLARPWFLDSGLAKDAQRISTANWDAAPQLVGFVAGTGCRTTAFSFNSVTQLTVETDWEFTVHGELLPAIPLGFVAAGEPLARSTGEPAVDWICGPVAPAGANRFRIALDRTWKTGAATYLIARHEGSSVARRTVQPAMVKLLENTAGKEQHITFEAIRALPAGTATVPLVAHSDSGLPVAFFVRSGPAVVVGDHLEFTAIPPRARYPLAVTVVAWQWGRPANPAVQAASLVEQTFHLLAPTTP